MATDTRVELRRNDGSEVFKLKANRSETEISHGMATDSIISGVSREILGGKLVLEVRTIDVTVDIQGMESGDYPNSGTYDGSTPSRPDDDDYGFRWELERASLEWGWDASNGFDRLYYDGRTFDGVFTNFSLDEDTEDGPPRHYSGTIEWSILDAWIS